jgi:hypothetical protein
MSKSRKFRKIMLKSEVSLLEEEEFFEQYETYNSEFNVDFGLEMAYLADKNKEEIKEKPEEEIEEIIPEEFSNEFLKTLHRELARVLHPDLNKNSSDEDFKKMQTAYERGDAAVMISLATEYNVSIDFDDEELDKIEKQIAFKNNKIKEKKNTCRWVWCTSKKNENTRNHIRNSLGINQEDFRKWLEKNNLTDVNN